MINIDKIEEKAMSEFPDPIGPGGRYDDGRLLREARNGYKKGYRQAEKDNELTWEDIREISALCYIEFDQYPKSNMPSAEKIYKDVLIKFKREKNGN